uniref:MAPK regulated corepressor interacting protein 2 n=1 Tax=Panthera tigris altaica TaxID=74533 RepID=A0A8C9MBD4_PANTA
MTPGSRQVGACPSGPYAALGQASCRQLERPITALGPADWDRPSGSLDIPHPTCSWSFAGHHLGSGQLLTGSSPLHSPGPRLVFNRVNGRRPPVTSPSLEGTQETYTLAHEENVRFVSEAWQQVERQLGGGPAGESGPRPVQYVEKTPNPRLQNFVPIDLDEWWAQQFLARVTNCS